MGSSLAEVTCETSQVLLVGGDVFFLGDLPFSTNYYLFVCVEVLRPCQQLRSCRAGQLPINTVLGQA